ncbi:hypothetical protein BJV78DRAFT_161691 [Lactifluus subvellereus]|nr:hypothetical protein BJV78DRAFT_161691 [Lactifluus subvellereus]
MLPFVVALIFAVGLPLLPASLHRALHLPSLRFNFLSAGRASEQLSVSPLETPLLLENTPPEDYADSNGPLQYLVLPPIDCLNDVATTPACVMMSLAETQDHYQSSIWETIHAQLLYQLSEATIIMTLSFFVASILIPRRYLSTLMGRLYTALFIRWQYGPKAAFSSFLQDVFCGIHKYWMDSSVTMGYASLTTTSTPRRAALGVFDNTSSDECCEVDISSPSSVPAHTLQDNLDLVALGKTDVCSESSPGLPLVTSHLSISPLPIDTICALSLVVSPHSPLNVTEISKREQSPDTLGPPLLCSPSRGPQPIGVTKATSDVFHITDTDISYNSGINLSGTVEAMGPSNDTSSPIIPSLVHNRTSPFFSMSMKDLYNSNRFCSAPISLPVPSCGAYKTGTSDQITCPSEHGSLTNVTGTTLSPEPEKRQTESRRTASLGSGRGRYKSDGIQVRSTRCHLGDPAALLDPARVDVTCAFWGSTLERSEEVEVLGREAPSTDFLPGSLAAMLIGRNKLEQADGSISAADAALAGIVVTPEGELVVPASQRPDGSMRKEIKVRGGHFLREPLVEKYRPPAARARTLTWDPCLHERFASPPSSPQARDSPLNSTPKSILRHRLFVRQGNSPACHSVNWRRSSSNPTMVGTLPTAEKATPIPPLMEVKLSSSVIETHERTLSPEISAQNPSLPSQAGVVQAANQLPSRPSRLGSTEEATVSALSEHGTEASTSTLVVTEGWSSRVNQQPEKPSSTPPTLLDAGREDRYPLQDIKVSLPVPAVVARFSYPPPAVSAPAIAIQVADSLREDALRAPIAISEIVAGMTQETISLSPPRKRKPSGEPDVLCVAESLQPSDSLAPYPRPRVRRSAPHLGKYGNNQQEKVHPATQIPEGSKRRRMWTASAKGVENWNVAAVEPAADRNGQIVLPAGTGWKGRSPAVGQPPQRPRQPTVVT